MNDDGILEEEITIEEVDIAIWKLKCGKTGTSGPSGVFGEHFKHGSHLVKLWLKQNFNSAVYV